MLLVIEELGAKTAKVTIFGDFLKYWEILGFFPAILYSRLMVHSKFSGNLGDLS